MWQEKQVDEKLTKFLEERITQAQLEADLEAEQSTEVEQSEAVKMEDMGATGGTQLSAMEVDKEEEDEVVLIEEIKHGKMRKRAPLSLPKMLRKRVQAGTATQRPVGCQVQGGSTQGSQVGLGNAGSTGRLCQRCRKYR